MTDMLDDLAADPEIAPKLQELLMRQEPCPVCKGGIFLREDCANCNHKGYILLESQTVIDDAVPKITNLYVQHEAATLLQGFIRDAQKFRWLCDPKNEWFIEHEMVGYDNDGDGRFDVYVKKWKAKLDIAMAKES